MKKNIHNTASFVALAIGLLLGSTTLAQTILNEAPKGFDQSRTGIATGKLDSIAYPSKTVGTTRKALIDQSLWALR